MKISKKNQKNPPTPPKKITPQKSFKKCFQKKFTFLLMATPKSLFERERVRERESERERERETRIITQCVLTYIGPIAECACFLTIMYWSAHVGT